MSVIEGVLAKYPKSEAQDKVLDNNADQIGMWKCWFLRRGVNPGVPREKQKVLV